MRLKNTVNLDSEGKRPAHTVRPERPGTTPPPHLMPTLQLNLLMP